MTRVDKDRTDESAEKGKLGEREKIPSHSHESGRHVYKYFRHCARVKEESLKIRQKKKRKKKKNIPKKYSVSKEKVWMRERKELFLKKSALRGTILDFVIYLKKEEN